MFFILMNLERCKPTQNDIENREKILKQLQKQFEKDYPDCNLHAFGSFYNGFGFRQSDLDVCIVFKDQREENVCIVLVFSYLNDLLHSLD
jgi:DNA polymerase sigma